MVVACLYELSNLVKIHSVLAVNNSETEPTPFERRYLLRLLRALFKDLFSKSFFSSSYESMEELVRMRFVDCLFLFYFLFIGYQ